MNTLNAQQLAFILDIKKEDARKKMLVAHCEETGEPLKVSYSKKKLVEELTYPGTMQIEMLARRLNLPTLKVMVEDIRNNYTKRPASRKYILQDYPEKKLQTISDRKTVKLPPGLKTLLSAESKNEILSVWQSRFPKNCIPETIERL